MWVSEVLGYKWYGLGQDLVGESTQGKATEELANLTDVFLDLLPDHLPEAEKARMDELSAAYRKWKEGEGDGSEPLQVFSGNVSGQGPGFAEIPMPAFERLGLLAMDKTGPSAFNVPVWTALQNCWQEGSVQRYLEGQDAGGILVEVWDVKDHRRVLLDFESERERLARLLAAIEDFNVKRVWSRKGSRWDPDRVEETLGRVLLSASTEKLAVITGGEYRGKDDPVLLAVEPIAHALNLFMRDGFYMTQGDGRGSHFMFPTPLPMTDAVATIYSRAVAVSAWIDLTKKGRSRPFATYSPAYDAASGQRITRIERIFYSSNSCDSLVCPSGEF